LIYAQDANNIQQVFSSEKLPTLWRALPALERLLSAWEKKKDDPHYALYAEALEAGIAKILKYYLMLDSKPAFVLALLLHPYFKLSYIEMAWGGEAEQEAEKAAGKKDAKNWYDEALQIVENAMRTYWATRPQAAPSTATAQPTTAIVDDFDLHRRTLLTREDSEGWQAELRRYLKDVPADISRDTDIVEYWQVRRDLVLLSSL
ncbi:hypothetical protein H0H87_012297, partial [Tephrocybe sp. NHM501043]